MPHSPWNWHLLISSVQLLSRVRLCNPMGCSRPGFPVHHQLLELTQTHVHQVNDAIQPSHPLSYSPPHAFNPSQHQGLFQWVSSSHQVAKVLELQLQHQSFQWIFRTDFLWDWLVGSPCSPMDSQVQFSSVTESCPTLCNPMDCSTPSLPVHHQLLEFTHTHVHWVGDGIQPSHPLLSPYPPAFNLSQHQSLFKWVIFSNTTVQKYQFFTAQLSLQSHSHIHMWLLEKP